jgi:hypothetical protein
MWLKAAAEKSSGIWDRSYFWEGLQVFVGNPLSAPEQLHLDL